MKASRADSQPVLHLPDIEPDDVPGARWVSRAVGLSVLALLIMLATAALVAALITVDVTVEARGVLEPIRIWPVRSHQAGIVEEIVVRGGQSVRSGQLLANLDSMQIGSEESELRAEYEMVRLDLELASSMLPLDRRRQQQEEARAQARLLSARATLRQRVVEYGFGTNVDSVLGAYVPGTHVGIDQALAAVMEGEADHRSAVVEDDRQHLQLLALRQGEADLARIKGKILAVRQRMRRLQIMAPAQGVVMTEDLSRLVGSYVREGDVLLEIGDPRAWRVTLWLSEAQVNEVAIGKPVRVKVPALGSQQERPLSGVVNSVADAPGSPDTPEPSGGSSTSRYRVVVSLDASTLTAEEMSRFRTGYTVEGTIVVHRDRALRLLVKSLRDKVEDVG